MWNWIRGGTLIVLILALIAGQARADCLDGQIGNFRFSGGAGVHTPPWIPVSEFINSSGSAHAEFQLGCCDPVCHDCSQLYQADVNVSTSSSGFTISARAEVPRSIFAGGDYASATVFAHVEYDQLGGQVDCTFAGENKHLSDDGLTVSPVQHGQLSCSVITRINNFTEPPLVLNCQLTATCVPTVSGRTREWTNPNGGSYGDAGNWTTNCVPAHDPPQRSDTAVFSLPTANFIPVSGNGTAGAWGISGSKVEFTGDAETFLLPNSLGVNGQGELRLSGLGSLRTTGALIGAFGNADSRVEVTDAADWTNLGAIKLGRGAIELRDQGGIQTEVLHVGEGHGPSTVLVVDPNATLTVNRDLVVGITHSGTLEIDRGLVTGGAQPGVIAAVGSGAAGTVVVRGDDSNPSTFGRLIIPDGDLYVGGNAAGRVSVERGGIVDVAGFLYLQTSGAHPAGELVIDPGAGTNLVSIGNELVVGAGNSQEVLVQNRGQLRAGKLSIGSSSPGADKADLTLRGGAGGVPTLDVVGPDPGPTSPTKVGVAAPGLLIIQSGAKARLDTGLDVSDGRQGIVLVSSLNAAPQTASSLTVTGVTNVGLNEEGIIQLDAGARMENNGDMKIGLSNGNPSGSVNLSDFGTSLQVNGTLTVGARGEGALNLANAAAVRTSTLVVGGGTMNAEGTVIVGGVSALIVDQNTTVGADAGPGVIFLAHPSAVMTIGGTMTIGSAAPGPERGQVWLVDATINGAGHIEVDSNGSLNGTGTVAVSHVAIRNGYIAPGLSPGTLTIEGDYEQLPGGTLVMEYAGLNPGEFDVLRVTGQTRLGGRLEVHFRNGFSPPDPAAFIHSQDFIEAEGGITGDYDERIYAFPDIFADFDNDGDKDLRDVAAFQNCFGRSGAGLLPQCARADWENNGVLDGTDIRELSARLDGADGIACPPGGSCPHVDCNRAVVDNPACGGLDDNDDDCLRGTCTPLGCVSTFEPFGSPCDDHIACTTRSVCGFGPTGFGCFAQDPAELNHALCPEQDFDDADCLRQVCDVALGCVAGVEPAGSLCDDGITCTTRSVCGSGPDGTGCLASAPADLNHALCPDHDNEDADCIRDICDPVQGCIPGDEPFGSPCDDGIECTKASECSGGKGDGGMECRTEDEEFDHSQCGNDDDDDADCRRSDCTAEGCFELNEPDQSPCDDGIPCTDQACFLGQCSSILVDSNCGEFGDIDADCNHVYCTLEGCVPGFEPDGSFCDDGLNCTLSAECRAGQCVGGFSPCGEEDDADENCSHAQCDEIEGCIFSVEPDGSPCLSLECAKQGLKSVCNAEGTCACQ